MIGIGCFLDGFTVLVAAAAITVLIAALHIGFASSIFERSGHRFV